MDRLDLTLPTPAENLALDEAILLAAEAGTGGEVLRLWELPTPAVVLGAAGVVADDVDRDACAAAGVPLARRSSGGGTVLLGPGCLLYSLVLAYDRDPALGEVTSSYRYILTRVADALRPLVPGSWEGSSDLAAAGRKFSGNAQQRKRTHLLHHGTLLCAGYDAAAVGRYLRQPPKQPSYRAGRPHAEFVTLLPATPSDVAGRLAAAWGAAGQPAAWPRDRVAELVAEKYGRDDWTLRR